MKQTCPQCKTIVEVDDTVYPINATIEQDCPVCGYTMSFLISPKSAVDVQSAPKDDTVKVVKADVVRAKSVTSPKDVQQKDILSEQLFDVLENTKPEKPKRSKRTRTKTTNPQISSYSDYATNYGRTQENVTTQHRSVYSFRGRSGRLNFIWNYLWAGVVMQIIAAWLVESGSGFVTFLAILIYLNSLIIVLAAGTRRCHDRGHSGFFQLIPFYGFVMLFGSGEPFPNEYGDVPN